MKRIILVGYMGVGKTTIGRCLAKKFGLQFYDLDDYIQSRYHKNIPEIFKEESERGFREIERRMLHEVCEFEDVLISCGGGTPCFFDNIDYMNRQGITVYLRTCPEILYKHLVMCKTPRPLLAGKSKDELMDFITRNLKEREPYYTRAQCIYRVPLLDDKTKVKEAVNDVYNLIENSNNKVEENEKMEN